jgi:hypothetical protein
MLVQVGIPEVLCAAYVFVYRLYLSQVDDGDFPSSENGMVFYTPVLVLSFEV